MAGEPTEQGEEAGHPALRRLPPGTLELALRAVPGEEGSPPGGGSR
jgi:hypothetical protein